MTDVSRSSVGTRAPVREGSSEGYLSELETRALFERCVTLAEGFPVRVAIHSRWTAGVRWARSRAHLANDARSVKIDLTIGSQIRRAGASANRIDDAGLREAMAFAKRQYQFSPDANYDTRPETRIQWPMAQPKLWSDTTAKFDGAQRGTVVRQLIDRVEDANLLTAGELLVTSQCTATYSTIGESRYYASTRAAFSATVRDSKGTGSGWAGTDDFDVTRIDMKGLGNRALEKCQRSINPVALEPGRYTAILEPQAVADLWNRVMHQRDVMRRQEAENPMGQVPFFRSPGRSKIGERVIDSRITVRADPMDPVGGFLPFAWWNNGTPYEPVSWIDQGVLRELEYEDWFAVPNLGLEKGLLNSFSWSMSGGNVSAEEMIATTKRGVLVTRFHGIKLVHLKSLTCTGYTRDGLWLIENGKISKPIKNFRFTESPLFVLNNVEQLGVPQRVFADSLEHSIVAPTIKVRDFNFTQLADAV